MYKRRRLQCTDAAVDVGHVFLARRALSRCLAVSLSRCLAVSLSRCLAAHRDTHLMKEKMEKRSQ